MKELSEKEREAIKILKDCGWQTTTGAHLEDWDEGQTVKTRYRDDEHLEVRSEIAIFKAW